MIAQALIQLFVTGFGLVFTFFILWGLFKALVKT